MSQCRYCGSSAYGYCGSSPSKVHEHNADGDHCEFCGSSSYGYCGTSPKKNTAMDPERVVVIAVAQATGTVAPAPLASMSIRYRRPWPQIANCGPSGAGRGAASKSSIWRIVVKDVGRTKRRTPIRRHPQLSPLPAYQA
jgi:hypothetical protein